MGNKPEDELKNLQFRIEQEKRNGLEMFRKSDFESNLIRRIESINRTGIEFRLQRLRPVLIMALCVFMIAAGWMIFKQIRTAGPHARNPASLSAVLEEILQVESSPLVSAPAAKISAAAEEFYRFEWSLRYVLNAVHHQLRNEDIPLVIFQVLEMTVKNRLDIQTNIRTGKQEMAEEIQILRKSGDYRSFFSQIINKFQEV